MAKDLREAPQNLSLKLSIYKVNTWMQTFFESCGYADVNAK